jgi:serine O-acetyltransferase
MVAAIREDRAMLHHYDAKYSDGRRGSGDTSLARDAVTRVGFQMLVAYRAMRFLVEAGVPVAPMVVSRLIRHAYGSDIHWEAEFEPGVVLVRGMGLAVSAAARVEKGAILFQHVTLGMSRDATTSRVGAPVIEHDAHIGAGAAIVGPTTIGAGSKVMAGCVVRASVPAESLVEAPAPGVTVRARGAQRSRSEFNS